MWIVPASSCHVRMEKQGQITIICQTLDLKCSHVEAAPWPKSRDGSHGMDQWIAWFPHYFTFCSILTCFEWAFFPSNYDVPFLRSQLYGLNDSVIIKSTEGCFWRCFFSITRSLPFWLRWARGLISSDSNFSACQIGGRTLDSEARLVGVWFLQNNSTSRTVMRKQGRGSSWL